MGAFEDVEPIVIPRSPEEAVLWNWEAHEQVILKGSITVADQEYVTNNYGSASKQGNIEYKMGAGRFSLLDRMILSWTFTKNGQSVPLTAANIRKLPARYANNILEVIDSIATVMKVEEQEDFLQGANGHTVESSNSTNLSLMK